MIGLSLIHPFPIPANTLDFSAQLAYTLILLLNIVVSVYQRFQQEAYLELLALCYLQALQVFLPAYQTHHFHFAAHFL